MSETITQENTTTENVNNVASGTTTENTTNEVVENTPVKTDNGLNKALSDLQKFKGQVKDLEAAAETGRLDKLREKEQWQDLSKEWQDKAEASEKRAETLEHSMIFDKKYSAVRELAIKSGLRNEALRDLELISLDDVEIEVTSTGRINVLNADAAVSRIKNSRPHWFGRSGNTINANEPEVVSGREVMYNDVVKAEVLAKKTGDYGPYKTLLMKYRDKMRR